MKIQLQIAFVCAFGFTFSSSIAQLKEFDVSEIPAPATIPIQAKNMDDALLFIYSSFDNLVFRSTIGGITEQRFNKQANRYEVFVKAVAQIIQVEANGFMEGRLARINPSPKDVYFYKVEEKKTETTTTTPANNPSANDFTLAQPTAESYFFQGMAKAAEHDHKGAIEEFTKSIVLNPLNAVSYYNRGIAKIHLNDTEEGCQDLYRAKDLGYKAGQDALERFCRNK